MKFEVEIKEIGIGTRFEIIEAGDQIEADEIAAEKFEGRKPDGYGGTYRSEVISVDEIE